MFEYEFLDYSLLSLSLCYKQEVKDTALLMIRRKFLFIPSFLIFVPLFQLWKLKCEECIATLLNK